MPEVRKEETLEVYVAELERRLRAVEALASRAAFQTVAVELANQFSLVTSGSFVPTMHANYPTISQPVLNVWVAVTTDPGTTGEVRLSEFYSGAVTDVIPVGASANNFASFEWLHGVDPGTLFEFRIDARRTSGAGNFRVYGPRRVCFEDVTMFPGAAENGNPVLL